MEWKYAASHFMLSALYFLPITLCWYWRVRRQTFSVQNRVSDFWRIVFTTMIFIGSFSRASFWFVQPFHVSKMIELNPVVNAYWAVFPGLFICTDYLVILFLWIQIYHSAEDNPVNMKPYFLYIIGIMYMVSFSLMIGDFITSTGKDHQKVISFDNTLQKSLVLFMASLYLMGSIGYVVYGIRFYLRLTRRPLLLSKVKTNILPRVLIVTALCGICFTTRAVLVLLDSFFNVFAGGGDDNERQ